MRECENKKKGKKEIKKYLLFESLGLKLVKAGHKIKILHCERKMANLIDELNDEAIC